MFNRPIRLKKGDTLTFIGPGRVEADISGEEGSCLSLKNCCVMNFTYVPCEKSGITYKLLGGVYLNFVNQYESMTARVDKIRHDAPANEVYFKGPLSLEELRDLQSKGLIKHWAF